MVKVTAIVVTYNASKLIYKCLSSILNSSVSPKIIVVDNASSDETLQIIYSTFPQVQVIKSVQNLGFGKANNLAMRVAIEEKSRYVFLINQDAWVEPNTIEKLIRCAEQDPLYYIISPIHLNADGSSYEYYFSQYTSSIQKELNTDNANSACLHPVDFVNAALWLLPNECVTTIGGFDPLFFHYGEDNDYINRVHYHGFKIAICANAIGYHQREASAGTYYTFYSLNRRISEYLIILKNVNARWLMAFFSVLRLAFRRMVKSLLLLKWQTLSLEINAFFNVLSKTFKVLEHREKCKRKNGMFIFK